MEVREKAAKYGMRTLSAAELIAAIVGGKDAARIGENVIEYTGAAPSDIARIVPEELTRIEGIGSTKAFAIAAAVEIARRIDREKNIVKPSAKTPGDVFAIVNGLLKFKKQESLLVLLVNAQCELESVEEISKGGLNSAIVEPREVFSPAIRKMAAAIIVVHNHPSGCLEPSTADLDLTRRLIDCGNIVGIKVLDHVIVSDTSYNSIREQNYNGLKFN